MLLRRETLALISDCPSKLLPLKEEGNKRREIMNTHATLYCTNTPYIIVNKPESLYGRIGNGGKDWEGWISWVLVWRKKQRASGRAFSCERSIVPGAQRGRGEEDIHGLVLYITFLTTRPFHLGRFYDSYDILYGRI